MSSRRTHDRDWSATGERRTFGSVQDEQLGVLPGVQRMASTLVMKQVVADHAIPI
jgi:hypothetical protein